MWRRIAVVSLMIAGLSAPIAWGETPIGMEAGQNRHRVVMHLNSGDERVQKHALSNVNHLYQALGADHVTVEVVVHGAGLGLLTRKETKFAEELERLHGLYGVAFTACSNTMKAMNVTIEDLIPQVDRTVPAMVRLIELQEAGWSYIKP
jgi:hypothetical protein